MSKPLRIAIVGAGVAGLATAKTLSVEGHDCVVFERAARVGGVWADGYCNFGVQAPKTLYEFPDWPMPSDIPDFTPGPTFQQYLEDYVDHFGLRKNIRLNAKVTRLERVCGTDGEWSLSSEADTGFQTETFDFVVIATGLYSNKPNLPTFDGQPSFAGTILHNSKVKTPDPLIGRKVVVLGYGKSAADVAFEAIKVAKQVHLVFREAHWSIPRKVAGVLPFQWGALTRLTSALLPLYQRPSAMERVLHSFGKPLVWVYWRLFELVLRVQLRFDWKTANGKNFIPSLPIEIDASGEGTMVARPEFYPAIRDGRIIAHRSEIERLTPEGLVLKDGTALEADCLVLATGWKTEFDYLSKDVRAALNFESDGFYLYRHLLHPAVPNLAFVGRATAVSNILTHSLQARWIAEMIGGRVRLPDATDMLREIEDIKRWKRSWMPFSPTRSTRVFMHAQYYHDELLRDIGADPLRKRGIFAPLKEVFAPYEPRDYAEIVAGNWARP